MRSTVPMTCCVLRMVSWCVCDLVSKLEERLGSMHPSLARNFDALTQSLLRNDDQLPCLESMVEQRCAAVQAFLGSDHDALSQSVERFGGSIGRLDDKLAKQILARRSMRENLFASVVAETSSRTELEVRVNELVDSFQFVAERVDVIDDWLNNRLRQ